MKKKYITSFMMLMTCLIFLTLQAQAFVTPYDPYSGFLPRKMPVVKRHLRGVWITTVQNLDWPSVQAVSIKNDKERIKTCKEELIAFLDRAVSMNMNAVFSGKPGSGCFLSIRLVPWSRYLTGTFGKDPGFDPLEFIIEQAHQRNRFHAWFNPYRVSVSTSSQTRTR